VVIVVLGVLSLLGVLKYIDMRRTAMAAQVAAEFTTIRLAAYNYEADHSNQFPPDAGPGLAPPELATYLPSGFSFTRAMYTLDWENIPSGDPYQVGVRLQTTDPRMMNALVQTLGSRAPYSVVGNTMTYVLIDRHGNY